MLITRTQPPSEPSTFTAFSLHRQAWPHAFGRHARKERVVFLARYRGTLPQTLG